MILSRPRPGRIATLGREVASRANPAGAVERVCDLEGLEALREEWDELLQASSSAEIFLTWEWLVTWWRCLGGRRQVAVLTVRKGERLVALLPLSVAAPRLAPTSTTSTLRFLGSGIVGSDYLDLIVRPGEEEFAIASLAAYLDRERRLLDLVQVRSGGSAVAELAKKLEQQGWTRLQRPTHVCPWIDLGGCTWDGYLAGLGVSHRANVRRRLRKLEQLPGFDFRRADTSPEVAEAFEALIRLHGLRWSERGGSDGLADPTVVAFHREFCRLALERGWLRLYVLYLDGRPAAGIYGFRYRHRFLLYQSGFDPRFAAHSVGLACLALTIRESIAEGISEFDFLHGVEPYKFLWARRSNTLARFELFPPTPEGELRRWIQRSGWVAKNGLRRWIAAGGPQPVPPAWQPARFEVET